MARTSVTVVVCCGGRRAIHDSHGALLAPIDNVTLYCPILFTSNGTFGIGVWWLFDHNFTHGQLSHSMASFNRESCEHVFVLEALGMIGYYRRIERVTNIWLLCSGMNNCRRPKLSSTDFMSAKYPRKFLSTITREPPLLRHHNNQSNCNSILYLRMKQYLTMPLGLTERKHAHNVMGEYSQSYAARVSDKLGAHIQLVPWNEVWDIVPGY
jgi:hypothetical protein